LGLLFPIYGKIKDDKSHVPNHQPVYVSLLEDNGNIIQLKFVVKFLHAFEVIEILCV